MKNSKVIKVGRDYLEFDNNIILHSNREYLDSSHLTIDEFEGLEFDLTSDNFFARIEGYGIELIPISGFSIKIPGYGRNNGCYSSNLSLVLTDNKEFTKEFDITECQDY